MKLNRKWLAVIMLLVMMFALTACGEKKEENPQPTEAPQAAAHPIVGLWVVDFDATMQATGFTLEEIEQEKTAMSDLYMSYEFFADGTVMGTQVMYGETMSAENTYTIEGDKITYATGYSVFFKQEGDKLILGEGEDMLVLFRGEQGAPLPTPKVTANAAHLIVGEWVLDRDVMMQGVSDEEYQQNKELYDTAEVSMEFTADGKLFMHSTAGGQTETREATYSVNGNMLTMVGSSGRFSIDGDKLTLVQGGISITYTRRK